MPLHADEVPAIAVVAKHGAGGFADLLLAELSSRKTLQLVERDELWRVYEEVGATAGFEKALNLAARLNAQGLLILSGDDKVRVRLVETTHGVILAQWLVDVGDRQFEEVTRRLADALAAQVPRLRLPPEARVFVSMRADHAKDLGYTDFQLLSRLNSLVAFRLARLPAVFLVEREDLAAVREERDPAAGSEGKWAAAGVVITARARRQDADSLRCVYQIREMHSGDLKAQEFEVDYALVEKTAEAVSAFLTKTLVVSAPPGAAIDLAHEAALYHYMATTAGAHQDYETALPLLELACLLAPDTRSWRLEFVGLVTKHAAKNTGATWVASRRFPEAAYMENVYWMRQAVQFQLAVDRAGAVRALLLDNWPFRFLTWDVRQFAPANRFSIASLRAELRTLLPVAAGGQAQQLSPRDMQAVAGFAPLFFETPQAAIGCLRSLMTMDGFPFASLHESVYTKVNYWDKEEAGRLWAEMLASLEASKEVEKQATVHFSRCFDSGAFDQYVAASPHLADAREAASKLFKWMDSDPAARQWILDKETWYIHLRLWEALLALPIKEQDYYYDRVMLALLRQHPDEENDAVQYARGRWFYNIKNKKQADDITTIRNNIRRLYETLPAAKEKSFEVWLKPRLTEQWLQEIFPEMGEGPAFVYPEIPNGKLVFDTGTVLESGTRQNEYCFDGFNGYVDGKRLWVAWGGASELGLACIDLESRTAKHFCIPVGERVSATDFQPFVLTRFGDTLYVAGVQRIYIIPMDGDAPDCRRDKVRMLGPQIGSHTIGFWGMARQNKNVSALIGCGKYLYIALDQPIVDGGARNRFGAILRWDGLSAPEQLAASDSLLPGPLNNCLPYSAFAAFADAKSSRLFFVLHDSRGQPQTAAEGQRNGLWEYDVRKETWRQIMHRSFEYPPDALNLNRMRTPDLYDFGDARRSYRFAISTETLLCGPGQTPGPGMELGLTVRYSCENNMMGRDLLLCSPQAPYERRLFHLNDNEFRFKRILPCDDGFYILFAVPRPGGVVPTNRGLIYFVPFTQTGTATTENTGPSKPKPGS